MSLGGGRGDRGVKPICPNFWAASYGAAMAASGGKGSGRCRTQAVGRWQKQILSKVGFSN